ncbi:hypothetical protein [Flexivirga caeni]|uniref:Integral membrane protein n=1 Tax=Flexivirga caeni TaxID=2294115 RepID=A0A3M9M716_9MICO|nr:hypothetical protein [Flexivirga caeni]RNI21369.1 hypothetical protein EFY87_11890 [Flexivirga caeni]
MGWLSAWWNDEVIGHYKGPLLLAFVAFVVTFLTTRTITRLIRAGKGPFHNVSDGGVHLHHSTPGTVLLVIGAFTALGARQTGPIAYLAALCVGVGASLVLDEFAMIFHLTDDYWTQDGQLSVNVVMLVTACLGMALVGVSPTSVTGLSGTARAVRGTVTVALLVHLVLVLATVAKGKYPTAVIGFFLAPVAWYAAFRIARPRSRWATRWYSPAKLERATARATKFDDRWGPVRRHWDDFVAGTPTPPSGPDAGAR